MKNIKKYLVTFAIIITCLSAVTIFASGLTFNGASTTGIITVTQEAWFTPAWEVAPNAGYGLIAGEKVCQTYVRITEGSFDSGKRWSTLSNNNQSWNTISISTSKFNVPLVTMYTYYGWTYFE
jgi:hypothetical protein